MTDAIHDQAAIIPRPADRVRDHRIGSVQTMTGLTLKIKISGDAIFVGGYVLNREQAETFAALFVRACWLAAQEE
jgi:hypothetical protein